MKSIFLNCRIEGICTIIPSNKISFDDEVSNYNFTKSQSMKLKAAFGLGERRVVIPGMCASDLAFAGFEDIFLRHPDLKSQIGAILFISQTPDYLMPPTANILQSRLGFSENVYCLDINQGCAGFIIGLFQAFQLLSTTSIDKVAVVNADALSARVSKRDRNSRPLVGDAAAITIVGRTSKKSSSIFNIKMDGSGAMALTIPAGGARLPADSTTCIEEMDAAGNFRSKDNLVMTGDAVFNFVQTKVPPLISESLFEAGINTTDIDHFIFHQPNEFMLKKLAGAMDIELSKVPIGIVRKYGNSSGATIPLAMVDELAQSLKSSLSSCCLAGFGVGLTWATAILEIGPLDFCYMKEI